jgi:hypothetical protein
METNGTIIYHLLTQAKSTETLNLFLPLIGVVVGGFLTIAGGLYLRKLGMEEERRKLLRGKLEELHLQLYELDKWVQEAGRIAMTFGSGQISSTKGKPVEDSPIVRIDMLVRFYFRSLCSYTDSLSAAVEVFRKGLFNYYADILEGKQPLKNDRYSQLIRLPAENIEKLRIQLREQLEKEIEKYI